MQRVKTITATFAIYALVVVVCVTTAAAWDLPPDLGTIPEVQAEEILQGNDYPETTSFTRKLDYVDFTANGAAFTQVVMRLDPARPLLHKGKKILIVATEEGSSSLNGFIIADEGKEGIGIWLAKRGITFITLNRVGRWNFFAPDRSRSWVPIPLDERMPIFSQHQSAYRSKDDYVSQPAGKTSSSSGSEFVRYPKPGTELYRQIVAATPVVMVDGLSTGCTTSCRTTNATTRCSSIGGFRHPAERRFGQARRSAGCTADDRCPDD